MSAAAPTNASGEAAKRARAALRAMAADEPELAARLVLATLPAAAAGVRGPLVFDLDVEGLGMQRVAVDAGGGARIAPAGADGDAVAGGDGGPPPEFTLVAEPRALAELAAGSGAGRLLLSRRLRVRGRRRRALRLRALGAADADGALAEAVRRGAPVDPDIVYRSLPYLVDPAWTRGHRFSVLYEIEGKGAWLVEVRDGERLVVRDAAPAQEAGTVLRLTAETFRRLVARELSPTLAMQNQLIRAEGPLYPVTLLGRWTDRAQGRDGAEAAREAAQRELLERRGPTWGARPAQAPAAGGALGAGDPGHEGGRRGGLLTYGQLYALWERQHWRAHEIDFSVDRAHWLATPREGQVSTEWSLGSFYLGEERVTADLAPFLMAAPSGEAEVFLSTQIVDEARHAAFFDRFAAEVMALEAGDLRGRLAEMDERMLGPWHAVFDDGLRDVAQRIAARPDDLALFVEGVTTYHMVVEGLLAVTGQHFIRTYMADHGLFPGFVEGFGFVERDEHRHLAFGVKFLKEAVEHDPRLGDVVERQIAELVPTAARVFCPPYAQSAEDFVSYGYHSSEIYGHAYRSLSRRMKAIGLQVPSAEELMPGPIDH